MNTIAIRYYMTLGSIEALSRLYNGFIKNGKTKEALIVRKLLLEYIERIGTYSEKLSLVDYERKNILSEPVDTEIVTAFITRKNTATTTV